MLMAEVAEDFLRRIEQGEDPGVAEYAERYPAIAEVLHQVLPVLMMVGSSRGVWPLAFQEEDTGMYPSAFWETLRSCGRSGVAVWAWYMRRERFP